MREMLIFKNEIPMDNGWSIEQKMCGYEEGQFQIIYVNEVCNNTNTSEYENCMLYATI